MNDYNELIERLAVSAGDQECLYSDAKEAMVVLLCAYKSVAKQLHDAEDVLKQNILNEFARIGVIDGQPGWIQHYCHERKEVVKDPLTLDGELHCTILPAVEALKAERDSLQSRVAELESRLEISPLHNVDGIMARDATIKLQDERIAELEAERAEREKQEPIGRIFFPKHRKAPDVHWADNTPILEGAAIYAAPPVTAPPEPIVCETCQGSGKIDERLGGYNFSNPSATCPDCDGLGEIEPIHDSRVAAPVRLTDDQVERALRTNGAYESDAAYAMAKDGLLTDARAIESAALRANGFKVEE